MICALNRQVVCRICLGCVWGAWLAAASEAGNPPDSPNNTGITRGKIPFSDHWGNPFQKLFKGPQSWDEHQNLVIPRCKGPVPVGDLDRSHWYGPSLRGDWHQHRWKDYAWSGDCYNDNWRTTTYFCNTKHAAVMEQFRQDSLAWEQMWCRKPEKCQAGYLHDTSGTSMLNFFRPQSPCGLPPNCHPLFGGNAPLYAPYRYPTLAAVPVSTVSPSPIRNAP